VSDGEKRLSPDVSIALDWIRGVSAQLVLFGHAISFLAMLSFLQPPRIPYLQNIGVILFFFISGVVIAFTIDRKDQNFLQFIFDRATRILTVLIPALVFAAVVDRFFLWSPRYAWLIQNEGPLTFIGNVLFLADYPIFRFVSRFGSIAPIWTVVLEFWIYVFFGFIALAVTVKARTSQIICFPLFALSILPVYDGLTAGRGIGLCFAWICGALYYQLILRPNRDPFPRPSLYISLACLAGFLIAFRGPMVTYGYDTRYTLAICLTVACSLEIVRSTRFTDQYLRTSKRLSHALAKFSFSLYLVHYTILQTIQVVLDKLPYVAGGLTKAAMLVGYFALSNLVAYAFYLAFEQHYPAVRRYLRDAFASGTQKRTGNEPNQPSISRD
jgi:peptidoglycan/LPS O-acetylase OafA/YrhL